MREKKIFPSQWEQKKTENFHLNGIITPIFSLTKIPVVHVCSLPPASAYLCDFCSQCSHHLSISGWSSGVNRVKACAHFIQKRTFMHSNCYYLNSLLSHKDDKSDWTCSFLPDSSPRRDFPVTKHGYKATCQIQERNFRSLPGEFPLGNKSSKCSSSVWTEQIEL